MQNVAVIYWRFMNYYPLVIINKIQILYSVYYRVTIIILLLTLNIFSLVTFKSITNKTLLGQWEKTGAFIWFQNSIPMDKSKSDWVIHLQEKKQLSHGKQIYP